MAKPEGEMPALPPAAAELEPVPGIVAEPAAEPAAPAVAPYEVDFSFSCTRFSFGGVLVLECLSYLCR